VAHEQKNKKRKLALGDVVLNDNDRTSLAMIVNKCDLHDDYWTVYREGKLEVWWEPNIVSALSRQSSE
jgi:hypothetical protein